MNMPEAAHRQVGREIASEDFTIRQTTILPEDAGFCNSS